MRNFAPLAVIVLAFLAWTGGHISERVFLYAFAGAHLAAPLWSAWHAPRGRRVRAALLGPGTLIALHAIGLVVAILASIGGPVEDTWINWMLILYWAGALAVYVIYCAIAFGAVASARRLS